MEKRGYDPICYPSEALIYRSLFPRGRGGRESHTQARRCITSAERRASRERSWGRSRAACCFWGSRKWRTRRECGWCCTDKRCIPMISWRTSLAFWMFCRRRRNGLPKKLNSWYAVFVWYLKRGERERENWWESWDLEPNVSILISFKNIPLIEFLIDEIKYLSHWYNLQTHELLNSNKVFGYDYIEYFQSSNHLFHAKLRDISYNSSILIVASINRNI